MPKLLIALALAAAACGNKSNPPASEPAPAAPSSPAEPMSPEECTAQGGEVRGDIGDGKIACAEGERDLGRVRHGIEGAVCCAPPAP